VEALEKKVIKASKGKSPMILTFSEQIEECHRAGIITAEEAQQLQAAETARQAVIKVDDFADEELRRPTVASKSKAEIKSTRERMKKTAKV
jgi:acyl-CoA dehydrogenase